MATLTPVAIDSAGEAPVYAAASGGGDVVATNNALTTLRVKNGSGSPITVTLTALKQCSDGFGPHDATYTVGAGAERAFKIPGRCVNAATGNAAVGYSSATSVTVAAEQ